MGFVTEYEIDRWMLKRSLLEQPTSNKPAPSADMLTKVFECDREIFGADRSALLHSLSQRAPNLSLFAQSGAQLDGYAFGRHGLFADHLGPWMARDRNSARSLLAEFLQHSARETIIVDALKLNPFAPELLREHGFSPARLLTRMYRGPNYFPGKKDTLCAILGPEFG